MKTKTNNFTLKTTVILMQMAFSSLAYAADTNKELDPETAELVNPISKVELGVGSVSEGSFKAGEYNGHENSGAYGIANIDLRGGAAYDSDETLRWRVTGKNLGLENRNIKGEVGDQGKFRLEFGYDELLRNRSDSYQTPYSGASSSNLTLPSNWVLPTLPVLSNAAANARGLSSAVSSSKGYLSGLLLSPSFNNLSSSNTIQNTDLPAFHLMELSTKREKYDVGVTYDLDDQWQFKASARRENKTGYKPIGSITRAFTASGATSATDISTILPDRIDQTTDQYNVALGFTGDKGFLNAAYYGSVFDNHVSSMSWQNWADPTKVATMSSAPSNEFNQFSLMGGYNFNPTTKLTMNGSYARSTQNDQFLTDASTPVVPRNSLDGLVVTTAFNMKLTAKPVKDLNFTGGYKYENRDNQTPVNVYGFYDDNEVASGTALNANFKTALASLTGMTLAQLGTLGTNLNINANRAYGKETQQVNLYADYMLKKGQWVGAGYDWQGISRKCDGSWISCSDADKSNEHTLKLDWRTSSIENVTTKLDYAYSQRTVNYNENAFLALVPMANVTPSGAPLNSSAYGAMLALGYSGYGPAFGLSPVATVGSNGAYYFTNNNALGNATYQNANRISELIGMRRYNMADRDRNKLKSSINWQATDRLSFQGGFNFNYDDYANSAYGLKSAKDWSLNLDGSFAVTEDFTLTSFYNHEDQQSKSAGNTYNPNSTTAPTVNTIANSISGGCAATVTARNANYKTLSCLDWSTNMQDNIDTIGLAFKRNKVFVSNFDLAGSLSYTWSSSDIGVNGGSYVANATNTGSGASAAPPVGQSAAYYISATALPTVTSKILALQLNGKYKINKASLVWVGYNFQHMASDDYAYQGMQVGGLAGVLPTSEKAPSYNVHNLGASYTYMF